MPKSFDVGVVGGGIVGLATALALVEGERRSLIVLEAEDRLAAHQSGRNSGVIHSGLYYRPDSLKARTCAAGREALYRFCAEEGIPHRRCGKLVVAADARELPALAELERRGRANGLHSLRRLDARELHDVEPAVAGVAALQVEETGVVDFATVATAFGRKVREAGGEIRTGARVETVERDGGELVLGTASGDVQVSLVVNCAGLQADRVARLCGVAPDVSILPFRGEYWEVVPERRDVVRHLIYPVPDPALPFLGVHLTPTIDGRLEAGPNAVLAMKREGYRRWNLSLRDVAEAVTYPGLWRLAGRYWRAGLAEVGRSLSKHLFARALRRLVPTLGPDDLQPGKSGVRAQAVDRAGRLLDDFHVLRGERSIHVLNAPSPAATAALAIGRFLAAQVDA